jgi:PPP family 3-phenylpropionic acid transporter
MHRVLEGGRLASYGAAYFFASGAFMGYWPVWLKDRGVSDAEIGTLYMARQLVSVVAILSIGLLAHRVAGSRAMLLMIAGASAVALGTYEFCYSFLALVLIGLVWGFLSSPVIPLYDSLLVNESRNRGFVYGSLRVWSSVTFIAGTLTCGLAVDRWGPPSVLFVGLAGIVCMVPLALVLPRSDARMRGQGSAPFGFADLLRSRPFLLFMTACALCGSSHAVLYSFGTLTWRGAGIDDVTISLLWGESVAVEVVLMMASGWLIQRLGVTGLIALGAACGVVRWTGMAFTTALPALIVLQALHAGTFAALHLGAMGFMQRALPPSGMALAQSVSAALAGGAAHAVVFQLSGLLYARLGQHAFLAMAALSVGGLVAILLLMRHWKGELLFGKADPLIAVGPKDTLAR